jgi:hypothetical protein
MAQQEHDREDLLAEARNLVQRASLKFDPGLVAAEPTVIVAGFRRDGSLAIYFAADRVYQFTSAGQLRRAYLGELLYRAEQGSLVSLQRVRSEHAVELISRPLDSQALAEFLAEMLGYLNELLRRMQASNFELIGQVPAEENVVARVADWLALHLASIRVASSPRSR